MNKNAIQRYAVWARTEMIAQVSQRAYQYGITAENFGDERDVSVGGRLLTETERKQRNALISEIRHRGYETVMEEVAYTWFNRLIALRFMEVNNYLPSHVRVFSDASGAFKPEILSDALHLELPGLEPERVAELIEGNRTDDLYRYLLLTQCNALNRALPRMFEEMGSYTELLLPNNILRPDGVIGRLVTDIPEADWTDQVQIIGWLYQYYNTEPKNAVFAGLKQNKKIEAKDIPAATQLFTPDWIVRYMVENSLGRLWLEGHPNEALKSNWRYYLDEAEQEPEVRAKLDELCAGYAKLRPDEIKVIDPCCGSGHIAVYMFDELMQIYESQGWTRRDAVRSILENNLYALDIDDRAAQLAYFAVMMKAREYDRRFLTRTDEGGHPDIPQPKVYGIIESAPMPEEAWDYFGPEKELAQYIYAQFAEAKTLGSAIQVNVSAEQLAALRARLEEMDRMADYGSLSVQALVGTACSVMWPLVDQAEIFAQKYDAVVTNPPYMGNGSMSAVLSYTEPNKQELILSRFVKNTYPDSKGDLFAVFIERCTRFAKVGGYQAMITQHAWMFLSSFERLRGKLMAMDTVNMAHLGARAFEEIGGEVVQTTSFVLRKGHVPGFKGTYARLVEPTTQQGKEDMFLSGENRYAASQDNFAKIPGAPVAYWTTEKLLTIYTKNVFVGDVAYVKKGLFTGNNDLFFRFWYEANFSMIDFEIEDRSQIVDGHYVPMNSGGPFRRWYGNCLHIIKFDNFHYNIITKNKGHRSPQFYFKESAVWTKVTSGNFSLRISQKGFVSNDASMAIYKKKANLRYLAGLLNSKVAQYCINLLNESLNYTTGNVSSVPYIELETSSEVVENVNSCISLSRVDWDSFETSWRFQHHPMVLAHYENAGYVKRGLLKGRNPNLIKDCYIQWATDCNLRFEKLKSNEEELNRIFIDIYGLQDELTPEVDDKDVTVRRADLGRDVRSLISYAVGCMFGRYSLDVPGLAYAGGGLAR